MSLRNIIATVRDGERVALWDRHGRVEFLTGPQRVWLRGRSAVPLQRHAAAADQYLVIRFKDGHAQHLHGPAAVWFHPVEHESIRVEPAVSLNANDAVVVYSHRPAPAVDARAPVRAAAQGAPPPGPPEPARVTRRVVRGPALFMPAADEWLHEFSWHGADPDDPTRKIPRALRFTKLRVIPDQMYFDVETVRTADDALLTVRLMIFFELIDIERMLDRTHDPVADFINAVTADVMGFAAGVGFEGFKQRTDSLSDLTTYPQLSARAEQIGYRVNKVVFRGYQAGGNLQAMHDGAIETRTRLRLEAETETQAQELADLKLRREMERAEKRRAMEEDNVVHANRLKKLAREEELRAAQAARQVELEAKKSSDERELDRLRRRNQERLSFLQAIHGMQVDVTRYLVSRYQHPDRTIRIDGSAKDVRRTQLHLHE